MIPLALVKQHLKVLHNREDELIQSYINAALLAFEDFTERKLYADQGALAADSKSPEHTAVINTGILQGALLLIGNYYSYRNAGGDFPKGTERLWQPYKVYRIA